MRTTARGTVLFFVDDNLYEGDSISNIHDRDLLCLWTALFVNSFVHSLDTLMKWGPLQNKHDSWVWFVSFYVLPDLVFTCTKTDSLSEIFVALGFSVCLISCSLFLSVFAGDTRIACNSCFLLNKFAKGREGRIHGCTAVSWTWIVTFVLFFVQPSNHFTGPLIYLLCHFLIFIGVIENL